MTLRRMAAAALGLGLLAGCGGSSGGDEPTVAATVPTTTPATQSGAACAAIKPNPPASGQPTIPPVTGKPPSKLVVKDVKAGHGPAAKKGSAVSVTYIGVACSSGTVFDASYEHGDQPFEVKPLGQAQVIQGWNDGLIGVKAGGVRELVIPPDLGYGAQGIGPIKPNETLIFLITVKSVQP